jgi:hypothetical protein
LLAIVRALKKWRSNLLGSLIYVYTDHRTLENFNTQRDLSCRQIRWQEFMSQYDLTIAYIKGEDNMVADALSRLPTAAFPDETPVTAPHAVWSQGKKVGAVLTVTADMSILEQIKAGYKVDDFCKKFYVPNFSTPGIQESNGLWYAGYRLIIPRVGDIREQLFRLAHDTLSPFGSDKSYVALRDAYYWPNMQRDLEESYIPTCVDCQRNKSRTKRPASPLHPLPVPEERGDSVAIDFIGPLPPDEGYDCILTMTDRLNSDIRIVPTRTTITAEELVVLFFDNWYCDNGLPLDIVSDRDKLFVSKFWRALCALTGVKLKMSTAYHPQTDGASERSNKTINQAIWYHVERNQRGWAKALLRVRFTMMNSVNASTGFSPFMPRMGRAPHIIPPIVPTSVPTDVVGSQETANAAAMVAEIQLNVAEAKDNLLMAKVSQVHSANAHRTADDVFEIGDRVMLSTLNRCHEYKSKNEKRVAKFFPHFDGPYTITKTHPDLSTYTIDMPNLPKVFPTFHASQLKRFIENDPSLFPSREHPWPKGIVTTEGIEEYSIDRIVDARRQGRGWSFLVRWTGYGPEEDRWLPGAELDDCEALDQWIGSGGAGPW